MEKYKKINSRKKYIIGFSFGAMIALLASTKVGVSGLILCSLSPYFKEDLSKRWISLIAKQRYSDFLSLECASLTRRIKARQVHMLYGLREDRLLKKRVNEAFDQISTDRKYLFAIKETEHNIGDKRYLDKIHQTAKQLN